jgi:hypothetical protein
VIRSCLLNFGTVTGGDSLGLLHFLHTLILAYAVVNPREGFAVMSDRVANRQQEDTCAVWTISLILKSQDDDVLREIVSETGLSNHI